MTDWRAFLTADEAKRIAELDAAKAANTRERRTIFDRARKRAQRNAR